MVLPKPDKTIVDFLFYLLCQILLWRKLWLYYGICQLLLPIANYFNACVLQQSS